MNKVHYLSVNIWVYFLSIDQKFELVTIIVTMAVTSASVWCVSWHQDQEKFNWPAPGAWWPVDHWQVTAQQSPRHWLVSNTSLTARTNGTISNYREKIMNLKNLKISLIWFSSFACLSNTENNLLYYLAIILRSNKLQKTTASLYLLLQAWIKSN